VSTDGNGRFVGLDPFTGAQLALAEAYRNVATTGARPLAVTDCLNFGSPEDPAVMWQFSEVTRGIAEGCRTLGIPVTGGNVSFYNQTGDTAILPTPIVGVLGVIDDVRRRTPIGFSAERQQIYLLGETLDEFDGSEWANALHGHLGGLPPRVDLDAEKNLAHVLITASRDGLIQAAHDLADGGLAQALVEACLRHHVGARVQLPDGLDPFIALFSESSARALVAVSPADEPRFRRLCMAEDVAHTVLGVTEGRGSEAVLDVRGLFSVPLGELRAAWSATLPAAFAS
jgi:phosphoribosylformylglycinamidine synthase